MRDLRNHALIALEKLSNHEIDVAEAGVTGKLCESIISTCKSEMEYAKMLGQDPNIPFIEEGRIIDSKSQHKEIEGSFNKSARLEYNETKKRS